MVSKMSYTKKNRMLAGLTVLGVVICWQFAFSKTFDAIKIHHELNRKTTTVNDLSFNRDYMERKLAAMTDILTTYQVNEEDWSNELWLRGSAASMKMNVEIDYTQEKPSVEPDSSSVGITQSLYCYGNYSELVKVMDSLESMQGIGKIAAIQIKGPKAELTRNGVGKCMLRMDFRALDLKQKQNEK